jgi:hypothetical protein
VPNEALHDLIPFAYFDLHLFIRGRCTSLAQTSLPSIPSIEIIFSRYKRHFYDHAFVLLDACKWVPATSRGRKLVVVEAQHLHVM